MAAADDYEYNQPANNFDNQQNQNQEQDQSYNNYDNNRSYDDGSYSASGDYQPQTPPAIQQNNYGYSYAPVDYYANAPAKYDYGYNVNDVTTGDIKSHSESRDGYNVRGSYSLVDPDGYKRTVTYTVDNVNGFNAVVNREPIAYKLSLPVVAYNSAAVDVKAATVEKNSNQDVTSKNTAEVRDSYSSPPTSDGSGPYA